MTDSRSNFRIWFDNAWADWIRPLGALILAGLAYLGYRFELLTEQLAGGALVAVIVIGILAMGVVPAFSLARSSSQRVMLGLLTLLTLIGAGWPALRIAVATRPLATAHFTPQLLKTTLHTGADGPYELVVSGRFKQAGASDVEAGYSLEVEGVGKGHVSGAIKRALHHFRTGRRGGTSTSVEERTEEVHRLEGVRGGDLSLTLDGIDEQLDGTLEVAVRSAGPRLEIFWALCGLALLLGLILDARLVVDLREEDRKVRGPKREQSYLTVVTAMLLLFAINFPMEATPRSLVRAGIGAFFLALLAGAPSGWLLAAFARLATRPKRRV